MTDLIDKLHVLTTNHRWTWHNPTADLLASLPEQAPGRHPAAAVRWRVNSFDPLMERLAADFPDQRAVNRYADFPHHRYLMATADGRDLDNDGAYEGWIAQGAPGIPAETSSQGSHSPQD